MNKDNYRCYTYQLDMKVLNILAIILFVVMMIVVCLIGIDYSDIAKYDILTLIVLMILWLMLHEILHGVGFVLFKEVNRKNIVFGMALEKGVFYCMCKQKISRQVIFTSLLFPFTIIGVITFILGVIIDNGLLVYLSMANIVGSIGDIMMSIYFSRCPREVVYLDLDDCTSFTVLSKSDISNVKVSGIKLVSSGNYDSNMKAKDRRRLVISRESWYVLIVIFILILVKIIGGVL